MSAPPRSTVMLPRLAPCSSPERESQCGSASTVDGCAQTVREIPVGPGGGRLLSNALCLAYVDLPAAVAAHLRMPLAPLAMAPLGVARAVLAIARVHSEGHSVRGARHAVRIELERIAHLAEGALVQELAARIASIEWPQWVPPAAFALAVLRDTHARRVGRSGRQDPAAFAPPVYCDTASVGDGSKPPRVPQGIACPLLAARVVCGIRGRVFLRDAAPALTSLLDRSGSLILPGIWDIWLPVRPGRVIAAPPSAAASMEAKA
jgi:hypothetical protein